MSWEAILISVAIVATGLTLSKRITKALADLATQQRNGVRRFELRQVLDATMKLRIHVDFVLDRASSEIVAIRGAGDAKIVPEDRVVFEGQILRLGELEQAISALEVSLSFCTAFSGESWLEIAHLTVDEARKITRDFRRHIEDTSDDNSENLRMAAIDYGVTSGRFPYGDYSERASLFKKYFSRIESDVTSMLGTY